MPSFGERLTAEFETEFARLVSEWYLPWHELMRGEAVDVDDFRGGRLQLANTHYDAVAEYAYWGAVRRYARNKIEETFARAGREIGPRGNRRAEAIAEETSVTLRVFLEKVQRHAAFTEYRLQERGYPDERYLDSRRDESIAAEIQRRKAVLLAKHGSRSWLGGMRGALARARLKRLILLVLLASLASGIAAIIWRQAG